LNRTRIERIKLIFADLFHFIRELKPNQRHPRSIELKFNTENYVTIYLCTEYFAGKKPSFSEKLGFYYPDVSCGLEVVVFLAYSLPEGCP